MLDFHTDDTTSWTLATDELVAAMRWRRVHGSGAAKAAKRGVDAFADWLGTDDAMARWKTSGVVPDPLWQVLWSRDAFPSSGRSETLAGVIEHFAGNTARKTRNEMVRMLMHEFDGTAPASPFELLALLTLLRTRSGQLPPETRLSLYRVTLLSARDFVARIDTKPPGIEPADQHLLKEGELPLLIGRVFDAVQGSTNLRRNGRDTLAMLLDEETDTDGTPHGRILDRLPLFLASLTRAVSSRRENGRDTFSKKNQSRFAALVRESALLSGQDGHPPLSKAKAFAPKSLMLAAMSVVDLPARDPARRHTTTLTSEFAGKSAKPSTRTKRPKFSVASGQSEWGGVATFRGDVANPPVVMTVDFHGVCPRLSVQVGGHSVISGEWHVETTVGGEPVPEPDGWSSVCWFSDEEADYLELQAELPDGRQLTRHLIYAQDDALIILAAAVRNAGAGVVESSVRLPLTETVSAIADPDSRLVQIKKPFPSRIIPLGLEADPFQSTAGSLSLSADAVTVRQANEADGICVPIAIDLQPKTKERKQIEWRRLTVAEAGRVISRGRGDAWRLRLGYHEDSPQWVYYQGLSEAETSRTILGMHTPYEMVFGRFEDGEIDPLVHVETE